MLQIEGRAKRATSLHSEAESALSPEPRVLAKSDLATQHSHTSRAYKFCTDTQRLDSFKAIAGLWHVSSNVQPNLRKGVPGRRPRDIVSCSRQGEVLDPEPNKPRGRR